MQGLKPYSEDDWSWLSVYLPVDWRWNGRNGKRHPRAGCRSAGEDSLTETCSHPTGEQDQQTWHGPVQRRGLNQFRVLAVAEEMNAVVRSGYLMWVNVTVMLNIQKPHPDWSFPSCLFPGAARPHQWSPSAGGNQHSSETEAFGG